MSLQANCCSLLKLDDPRKNSLSRFRKAPDTRASRIQEIRKYINFSLVIFWASLVTHGWESACTAGGLGSIPGSERSPWEENGNPLQYACLENPMEEKPGRLQSMGSQRVHILIVTCILFDSAVYHLEIYTVEIYTQAEMSKNKCSKQHWYNCLNLLLSKPTKWTWIWVNSRSWWWTRRPGVL